MAPTRDSHEDSGSQDMQICQEGLGVLLGYKKTYLDPGGQYWGSEKKWKGLQPRVLPRQMTVGGSDWRMGLGSERRPTSQPQYYRLCWRNVR